jgi:hypothetical protein
MAAAHHPAGRRPPVPPDDPDGREEGRWLGARATTEMARARGLLVDADRLHRTAAELRSVAASARVDARLVRAGGLDRPASV